MILLNSLLLRGNIKIPYSADRQKAFSVSLCPNFSVCYAPPIRPNKHHTGDWQGGR